MPSARETERTRRAAIGLLGASALLYGGLALGCLAFPEECASQLGLSFEGPAGLSEVLAVLAGIPAAFAVTCIDALVHPARREGALRFLAILNGGFVAARVAAIARVGWGGLGDTRFALALECLLFAAALTACVATPASETRTP